MREGEFFGKAVAVLSWVWIVYAETLLELEKRYGIPREEVLAIIEGKAREHDGELLEHVRSIGR